MLFHLVRDWEPLSRRRKRRPRVGVPPSGFASGGGGNGPPSSSITSFLWAWHNRRRRHPTSIAEFREMAVQNPMCHLRRRRKNHSIAQFGGRVIEKGRTFRLEPLVGPKGAGLRGITLTGREASGPLEGPPEEHPPPPGCCIGRARREGYFPCPGVSSTAGHSDGPSARL